MGGTLFVLRLRFFADECIVVCVCVCSVHRFVEVGSFQVKPQLLYIAAFSWEFECMFSQFLVQYVAFQKIHCLEKFD